MKRRTTLLFACLAAVVLGLGSQANAMFATRRQCYGMLDSTFRLADMGIPERNVPSSLSDSSVRRFFALGIATETNESAYDEPLSFKQLKIDLVGLFFPNAMGDFFDRMGPIKTELVGLGIDIDSLEAAARGLGSFSVTEDDTVSVQTLAGFSSLATHHPVIAMPILEGTIGDTAEAVVTALSSSFPMSAFRTTFYSTIQFADVDSLNTKNGFLAFFSRIDDASNNTTAYSLVGINTTADGVSGSRVDLCGMEVIPRDSGRILVRQRDAVLADTTGESYVPVWPMLALWGIYSRFDVNRNFQVSGDIADAVFASRLILHGTPPALRYLGDVNRNGFLDPNDVFIVLKNTLPVGTPKISAASAPLASTHGTLEVTLAPNDDRPYVSVKFKGQVGNAVRAAVRIRFDDRVVSLDTVNFSVPAIDGITGWASDPGVVNALIYPQQMAEGELMTFRFRRISGGDPNFRVEPLGRNFLDFGETVALSYLVSTDVEEREVRPFAFELGQNYPNPVNGTTVISYSLEHAASPELRLYNILGEEVLTRAFGLQTPGRYAVTVDVSGLPSGLYFYKLRAGDLSATKKLMIIK